MDITVKEEDLSLENVDPTKNESLDVVRSKFQGQIDECFRRKEYLKIIDLLREQRKVYHDRWNKGKSQTTLRLSKMIEAKDQMRVEFAEETKRTKKRAHEQLQMFLDEQERIKKEFEVSKEKLDAWNEKLNNREPHHVFHERMKRRLDEDKQKMEVVSKKLQEMETLQQERKRRKSEYLLRMVEEDKKKTEEAHAKILQMDRKESRQMLDLVIEELRVKVEGKQPLGNDYGDASQNKIKELNEELQQKQNDIVDIEELNRTLLIKERMSNDELQEARKELIKGLQETMGNRAQIGIKRMGEIDIKPFQIVCKNKFPAADVEVKLAELYSLWQDKMRQPEWHPFRIIENADGVHEQIIDEDDEQLKGLKEDYGVEVYEAVAVALKQMNEYNPSGGYVVSELWNFKENRKASMKEVIAFNNKNLKELRRRRK